MSAEPPHGGRTGAEHPEVIELLKALADRLRAAHDGVLARVTEAGQLQRDRATSIGDDETLRCQVGEHRTSRRRIHLVLAELREREIDLVEQLLARQRATAQTAGALDATGRGAPGSPFGLLERAPARAHAREDGTNAHLRRGLRVGRDDEGTADLAVPAILRHV